MVDEIVTYLNVQLQELNYFQESLCLCELLEYNDKRQPRLYSGKGQYKPIDIDSFNGISYWRRNGEVSKERLDSIVACDERMLLTIPLRLIAIVPRKKLSTDDAYAGDRMQNTILKALEDDVTSLKESIQAIRVSLEMTSCTDDAREIVTEEYDNEKAVLFENLYLRMDLDAVVDINKSCLLTECS